MLVQIAIVLLIITLVLGIPVPFAFFASTIFLVITAGYDPSFLLPYGYSKMSTSVLLAIPLFILAGGFMAKGKIGGKLIDLVEVFVGRIKGGLGVVAVVSCAVFGSITGSAAATLSVIGSLMFPRLEKAGYPKGHSAALIANAAVLGMLIPPSSIMILYAWIGNQSVLASFLASVIPGIILVVLISLVNIWLLRNNKDIVINEKMDFSTRTRLLGKRTVSAGPALVMPVMVLGGIYSGMFTPTEAAALAALYAIPVGFFIYKGLNRKNFIESIIESAVTTGVIMVMLYSVMILSRLYITEDLTGVLAGFLTAISEDKYIILLMMNIFMIIMGMIMDDVSAVLLCTPILLPIAIQIGISPVHFAAVVGVNLGMGNITPPTAPLLYLSSRLGNAPLKNMFTPTFYLLVFAWLPTLLITTYLPALSMWLPQLVLGK
ncbi:TRAP transporter large permease [Desulfotomaculum sp. 1211_IL3151]|uniref:TRAP transporter large permease n=1 Tax=Desulfotomaculum sp. 1211_IL3151 TaxID=3084055 RepID=UPI002FDAB34E